MSEVLPLDEPDGYQTQTTSLGGGFARIASPTDWVAFRMGSRQGALAKDRVTDLFRPPDDWSFEGRAPEIAQLRLDGRRLAGIMSGITLT